MTSLFYLQHQSTSLIPEWNGTVELRKYKDLSFGDRLLA